MRYPSGAAFLADPSKNVTLMAMSNVGKTRAASRLNTGRWFHYSVDYRLATAHLREPIVDSLKLEMMQNPRLARHLRDDAVRVDVRVAFSNLAAVSHYLGLLGDPARGGLPEAEFRARQARHRAAEIAAVLEANDFARRARDIYGYPHFVNDASGSLCELVDLDDPQDPVLAAITDHSVLVYLEADGALEAELAARAKASPKPLYYRPGFLDEALAAYAEERGEPSNLPDPADFVAWTYPRLLAARRPRYAALARHGYVVDAAAIAAATSETEILNLIADAIDRGAAGETGSSVRNAAELACAHP